MFYDQLKKLCDEKDIKITPLVKELGMSTGSIKRWQEGVAPNGETLLKFADYFGVTTDYLLGRTENPNPIITPLPIEKLKFLEEIESLSPERQKALDMALRILKSEEKEKSLMKNT